MACNTYCYIQWRIQGRVPGSPLIFRPNWGPKGRKNVSWRLPPPFVRVWMNGHPLLSEGLDPPLIYRLKRRLAIINHQKNEENHTIRTCSFISCSCCCNWVNSWALISGLALAFDWQGAVAKAKGKVTLVTSWKKKSKRKKKGIKLFDLFYST